MTVAVDLDRHVIVRAFVDELAGAGIAHACLCPGSRSTPLAILLRRHPDIRVWTHLDERSAAFFALGLAKAGRTPVVLLSTSGTAAVNFAPAVVEAYHARVPLLVLTADRPPELRHLGALQTIDQLRLYGQHVKWFVDMALPETSVDAVRYARTIACRAAATARANGAPGPVHINFPFREPLVPVRDAAEASDEIAGGAGASGPGGQPRAARDEREDRPARLAIRQPRCRPDVHELTAIATDLRASQRGLIVCGPQDDPELPAAVASLARELRFPVLADPLSLVRCGPHLAPLIIDSYDAFLRDDATAEALRPDCILRFGAVPTSKALQDYLQRHGQPRLDQLSRPRHLLVDSGLVEHADRWVDPTLTASDVVESDARSFCEALRGALQCNAGTPPNAPTPGERSPWTERWIETARITRTALCTRLDRERDLSEPGVFAELAELLPAGTSLFVGNSMPVRDLDTFFRGSPRPLRLLANRGASGIDGVVSTALGAGAIGPEPLVLVIGDLSFYHDMNGLLAARRFKLTATIVLLNNDGGGIFSFLPQADDPEYFEELFGTPHALDFRPAAEMYGIAYRHARTRDEFRAALRQALGARGVSLIEVRTERPANAELHRSLWKAVAHAVRDGTPDGSDG